MGSWIGHNLAAGSAPVTVVSPVLILVLCVVAGIGTVLLLPSRREAAVRKIGGVILLTAALIFAALVVRYVATLKDPVTDQPTGGMSIYFWIFAIIALVGSIRVVTHARPVYSALYFVLTVFASAGLFVLLWAEFMAAALVLIYAGAILVTYVFVIMLAMQSQSGGSDKPTATEMLAEYDRVSREPFIASAVGFGLMGILLLVIFDKAPGGPLDTTRQVVATTTQPSTTQPAYAPGSAQSVGSYLFKKQLLNLELAGLILTIGMVGAILIARRRVDGGSVAPPAPPVMVDDNPHSLPVVGTDNPRAKAYPEK